MKKVMLAGAVALAFATVAVGTASVEASSYYTSGTHYHNTWNTTSTENYRRNNFKKRKEELKLLAEKRKLQLNISFILTRQQLRKKGSILLI